MSDRSLFHDETHLQHLGEDEHVKGAVTPPIFQTSLFVFDTVAEFQAAGDVTHPEQTRSIYSRVGNPNLTFVEKKIAQLERAESCRLVNSGMSAMSAVILGNASAGSHIVCVDTVYGPTRKFLESLMARYGVETTFVDASNSEEIMDSVGENTSLIYLETPSSVVFQIQDLGQIATFARSRGIKTCVDSTYNAGLGLRPHTLGIDYVMHTVSKYFGGHSDLIGGAICGSKEDIDRLLTLELETLGTLMPPFNAWLTLRGLRTLALRFQQSRQNAMVLAEAVAGLPEFESVIHVGRPDHPQAKLIESLGMQSGGLFSAIPKTRDVAKIHRFCESLELFQIGVSWGGFESLAIPLNMAPLAWPEPRDFVRFYCGLEHGPDLVADVTRCAHLLRD